jgi:hypothetical protein
MSYASVSVNIWFPSIIGQTPGSIFLWLIGVTRKVPFDEQLRPTAHPRWRAILDLVSVD